MLYICDRRSMEHYFQFQRLDSAHALEQSYALRHEVYCNECGFLPAAAFPDGLETDEFDDASIHFGGYTLDGSMAGTVRLVVGELKDLPCAQKCTLDPTLLPRDTTIETVAEVSRLAVSRRFRRRATDGILPDMRDGPTDAAMHSNRRRNSPELVLGLYKTMYQESKRRGIQYWFAAMETSLARLLERFDFHFQPVGPEVDYYGPVTPYVARLADLEAEIFAHNPAMLAELADGLERALYPSQLIPGATMPPSLRQTARLSA